MRTSGTFAFPPMDQVIYGKPAGAAVLDEVKRLNAKRVFLVVSRTLNTKTDEIEKVRTSLGDSFAGLFDRVPPHTSRIEVMEATAEALEARADLIVAIGGGSTIDAAKIMLPCIEHKFTDPDALDGFEVTVGPDRQRRLKRSFNNPTVRMIAVPSTLSGGEYNAGCLVTDPRRNLKQTFFHPLMMPRAIILDPELTRYTPEKLWLGSGTRAMDHGIEALCSPKGNPLVDGVVLRGLRILRDFLPKTKADPSNLEVRRQCQFGSWLSSFGLQTRVPMGASHAIGHVLGGTCGVPHYLCTPVMMPSVLRYNSPATSEAQALLVEAWGSPGKSAGDAFAAFIAELGLPQRLAEVGVSAAQFPLIGELSMEEIFTHTNAQPIRNAEDVVAILKMAA
jgi:maleylacetate reductase